MCVIVGIVVLFCFSIIGRNHIFFVHLEQSTLAVLQCIRLTISYLVIITMTLQQQYHQ